METDLSPFVVRVGRISLAIRRLSSPPPGPGGARPAPQLQTRLAQPALREIDQMETD
jgi:hypothetical protein